MADDAKAFCPACGHAFVAEQKREQPSEFERMDGTMQLGKTMYNQMLSDMGLNLKAKPAAPHEPNRQVIRSIPIAEPQAQAPVSAQSAAEPVQRPRNKLLIFGIIAAFLILGLIVLIAAAVLLWMRFG